MAKKKTTKKTAKKKAAKTTTKKKTAKKKATKKTATKKKAAKKTAKKKEAKTKTTKKKRKSRTKKSAVEVRKKMFWGVFNHAMKRVALYEFNQRKAAEKRAKELSPEGKPPHFVQKIKEEITD